MGDSNDTGLTLRALDMALTSHNPPKVLHHSDRGSNYTANDYRQALSDRGIDVLVFHLLARPVELDVMPGAHAREELDTQQMGESKSRL